MATELGVEAAFASSTVSLICQQASAPVVEVVVWLWCGLAMAFLTPGGRPFGSYIPCSGSSRASATFGFPRDLFVAVVGYRRFLWQLTKFMLLRVRVEPFFRHVRLLLEQHTCVGGMQGQGQSKGWAANHVCLLDEVPLPNSDFDSCF
jgi:hypothetical protein